MLSTFEQNILAKNIFIFQKVAPNALPAFLTSFNLN